MDNRLFGKQRLPSSLLEAAHGNWVGPERSGGRTTFGVWDRLTEDDLKTLPVDTWDYDGMDHDVAYDKAQKAFIDDLNDLDMPASEAVKKYMRSLSEADAVITQAARNATANGTVGDILRRGAQWLFPVKSDAQSRIIDQIENNPGYRNSIDSSDRTAIVNYFGSVNGIMGEDANLRGRENDKMRNLGGDGPVPEPVFQFTGFVRPKDGVIAAPVPPEQFADYYERYPVRRRADTVPPSIFATEPHPSGFAMQGGALFGRSPNRIGLLSDWLESDPFGQPTSAPSPMSPRSGSPKPTQFPSPVFPPASMPDNMDWVRQLDPQPREFWHPEVPELPRILWADDPFGPRRGAGPRPDWLED
jgi:hypothetical protein